MHSYSTPVTPLGTGVDSAQSTMVVEQTHEDVEVYTTYEGADALPQDVHGDGSEPTEGLARAENEKRHLDTPAQDHAVREERRAIQDHILPKVA